MDAYLDRAPCLYFCCDEDGLLLDVNDTLARKLQYEREALVGRKVDILFTLATRIFFQTHFFPLLRMQHHAEEIYITLKGTDGTELPVLVNVERQDDGGRIRYCYVGIALYHRKKFEDELIAAKKAAETALRENTELQRTQEELRTHAAQLDEQIGLVEMQNEELRQFNRVVTHDLQEPLRKLSVFLNMLRESAQGTLPVVDKLMRISGDLRTVVSGLQQYVWLTDARNHFVRVDLGKLLLVVQQELAPQYPDVRLSVTLEDLPVLQADWKQMHLLFSELLSNALRFRKDPQEARVHITVNTVTQNRYRNLKDRYQYMEFLKLRVHDEGVGFAPEYTDQAFALFKRLHPQSGRGVGLSLCRKVIENHQGSISIESAVNEGTTVTILLPIAVTSDTIIASPNPLPEKHHGTEA
ncbi:sensor histidine kinase [Flaviaesturariibacter amylovorans]|uniref:histidine kinase n=1 Tax=Flaviaesturariibacter amylovorans TaxID=1084520 RepID=A0ABP8HSM9_9BACT